MLTDITHYLYAEETVLGCMITGTPALKSASDSLDESDFLKKEHQIIFSILKKASQQDKPASVELVCRELEKYNKLDKVGGMGYVADLALKAGTGADLEYYIEEIKKESVCRKGKELCKQAERNLSDNPEDSKDILNDLSSKLRDLDKKYSPSDKASIEEILSGSKSRVNSSPFIQRIKERVEYYNQKGEPFFPGIRTGFKDLDAKVSLLEDTNLIVIAGRPAMGKTALALNIANNVCANYGHAVGFISLEMSADQLAERLLSTRTHISGEKIKRGILSDKEIKQIAEQAELLRKELFFIHDTAVSSVYQIVSRARRLKDEENIKLLVIDYLQLLGTGKKAESRQYEVAEVSRTLKMLAMELKIPVICVSQLSRKVEERPDKKPKMSDLRDSGQIEQDCDAILLVYRRSYYDKTDKPGQAQVIVAKNRHGSTPSVDLYFQEECGFFGNLSPLNLKQPQEDNSSWRTA